MAPWKGEQHEAIIVCMTVSATYSNKYRSVYGGPHLRAVEQCTPSFLEPPKSQVILSAENSWVYPTKDTFSQITGLTNYPLSLGDAHLPKDPRVELVSGIDLTLSRPTDFLRKMSRISKM